MIRKLYLLTLLIVIASLFTTSSIQGQNGNNSTKKIKKILKKMKFIESGWHFLGFTLETESTSEDSTLMRYVLPREERIMDFFISSTEVTNREWNDFFLDKVKEEGRLVATQKYYPDTTAWVREFSYSYNEKFTKWYSHSSKFDNYPVVGISWKQSIDYCLWLTEKVNKYLKEKGFKEEVSIRLPTEAEWEYAACGSKEYLPKSKREKDIIYGRKISYYSWSKFLNWYDEDYMANFGQVFDKNKIKIKHRVDDGFFYTAPVKSFPKNRNGLYDMSGNVSEWVQEPIETLYKRFGKDTIVNFRSTEDFDIEINYLENKDEWKSDEFIKHTIQKLKHDRNFFEIDKLKIAKGGSWDDSLIYLLAGKRQGFNQFTKSSKIGFRIAISASNKLKKILK